MSILLSIISYPNLGRASHHSILLLLSPLDYSTFHSAFLSHLPGFSKLTDRILSPHFSSADDDVSNPRVLLDTLKPICCVNSRNWQSKCCSPPYHLPPTVQGRVIRVVLTRSSSFLARSSIHTIGCPSRYCRAVLLNMLLPARMKSPQRRRSTILIQ